ncbi:glycosyltransferase family 2 protein [Candidatus Woesearchaeota archaeon]|nr:glycosyltransferase family 2 protein [Candidatus Woesearchaeota archaeon]
MQETNKEQVWVVIAAYNEEKRIGNVISSILKNGYSHVVVVDDGSKDATAAVAENAGAEVLCHIMNRGQGASLKTGMDFAVRSGAKIVVTFDADGQHHAEEIPLLTMPIERGEVEACLGSRFLEKESNVSWHRKFLLKGGAVIIWMFYGIHLTDTHNGFRALKAEAVQKLQLCADRMEHASEILEQIAKQKIKYKEVPVTITYTDYSLQKGQRSTAALAILWNMIRSKILR